MLGTVSRRSKIALVLALSFAALSLFNDDPFITLLYALPAVLTLVVLYFVVRWAVVDGLIDAGRGQQQAHGGAALDVLDERYARGEMGREEYLRMRQDIGRG